MIIKGLCLRKTAQNKAKSSLIRLDFIKNEPSKKRISYCGSNSCTS